MLQSPATQLCRYSTTRIVDSCIVELFDYCKFYESEWIRFYFDNGSDHSEHAFPLNSKCYNNLSNHFMVVATTIFPSWKICIISPIAFNFAPPDLHHHPPNSGDFLSNIDDIFLFFHSFLSFRYALDSIHVFLCALVIFAYLEFCFASSNVDCQRLCRKSNQIDSQQNNKLKWEESWRKSPLSDERCKCHKSIYNTNNSNNNNAHIYWHSLFCWLRRGGEGAGQRQLHSPGKESSHGIGIIVK